MRRNVFNRPTLQPPGQMLMKWITNKWPILGEQLCEDTSPRSRWQDWCGGAMLAMMVLASLIMMIWSLPAPGLADNWPREAAKGKLYAHSAAVQSECSLEKDRVSQHILHHC
ncbi:hypothetical protein ACXV6R_004090 [Yersinia enterocolitica]|uniref:Putative fimbrial membrane protein n=1 Tax=Yersinia enterocolitica TaxID=630 RepID=F2Q826_YEREN|nr:putative fimbrial membrane protein [Yersinia enterocolitica]